MVLQFLPISANEHKSLARTASQVLEFQMSGYSTIPVCRHTIVGAIDGELEVGKFVGDVVGIDEDGDEVGTEEDGDRVGERVGDSVGDSVGTPVVGELVGETVGDSVGVEVDGEVVGAKVGFLEFTGQGLDPVKDALEKLETLMAVAGTRLIEHSKKTIERAETLRIRSSGDSATLSSIANTAEKGWRRVLKYYHE